MSVCWINYFNAIFCWETLVFVKTIMVKLVLGREKKILVQKFGWWTKFSVKLRWFIFCIFFVIYFRKQIKVCGWKKFCVNKKRNCEIFLRIFFVIFFYERFFFITTVTIIITITTLPSVTSVTIFLPSVLSQREECGKVLVAIWYSKGHFFTKVYQPTDWQTDGPTTRHLKQVGLKGSKKNGHPLPVS